jgi:hypothetical protein
MDIFYLNRRLIRVKVRRGYQNETAGRDLMSGYHLAGWAPMPG